MRFTRRPAIDANFRYLYFLFLFNLALIIIVFFVYLPRFSASAGLSLRLASSVASEPVAKGDFIVSILGDNSLYLGSREVTKEDLAKFFSSRKRDSFKALIKVDQKASVGLLVGVWDILRKSGASEVSIAANES